MSKDSVHLAYQVAISFVQFITPLIDKFNQEDANYHAVVSTDVDTTHKDYEKVLIYVDCIDAAHGVTERLKFDMDVGGRTVKQLLKMPVEMQLRGIQIAAIMQQTDVLRAIQSWRADQYKLDAVEEGEL